MIIGGLRELELQIKVMSRYFLLHRLWVVKNSDENKFNNPNKTGIAQMYGLLMKNLRGAARCNPLV